MKLLMPCSKVSLLNKKGYYERNKSIFRRFKTDFTGSPTIVPGGFNLDKTSQNFRVGDVIPAGTLAIYDEQKRTVKVVKTAKVLSVKGTTVTLYVDEFYEPIFCEGDRVAKAGAISGTWANAVTITKVVKTPNSCVITLSAAISGLAADNIIQEVVKSGDNAAEIGTANAVFITDTDVRQDESQVDVCDHTLNYRMFERRVPPIPASQKSADGRALKGNANVLLTQSY